MGSNPIQLRNCRFAFECPKSWDALIETTESSIRYCVHCDRGVHFCGTDEALAQAVSRNLCVAIEVRGTDTSDDKGQTTMMIGEPAAEYKVSKRDK